MAEHNYLGFLYKIQHTFKGAFDEIGKVYQAQRYPREKPKITIRFGQNCPGEVVGLKAQPSPLC